MSGFPLALASAVLFGAATPAAKMLLADLTAFQLAGLLYLGGAVGIAPRVLWRRERRPPLDGITRTRLGGAVILGGVVAPVLLLLGLRVAPAGSVSLLLNFEVAATAVIGVLLFGEALGAPGWLGVGGVIVAGTVLPSGSGWPGVVSAMLVGAACICWGFDNNSTALIDGMSPSETTLWKTAIAGMTNLVMGAVLEPLRAPLPASQRPSASARSPTGRASHSTSPPRTRRGRFARSRSSRRRPSSARSSRGSRSASPSSRCSSSLAGSSSPASSS